MYPANIYSRKRGELGGSRLVQPQRTCSWRRGLSYKEIAFTRLFTNVSILSGNLVCKRRLKKSYNLEAYSYFWIKILNMYVWTMAKLNFAVCIKAQSTNNTRFSISSQFSAPYVPITDGLWVQQEHRGSLVPWPRSVEWQYRSHIIARRQSAPTYDRRVSPR